MGDSYIKNNIATVPIKSSNDKFLPTLYSQAYQIQKGAHAGKKVRKIVNRYRDLRVDQNVMLIPGCFLLTAYLQIQPKLTSKLLNFRL